MLLIRTLTRARLSMNTLPGLPDSVLSSATLAQLPTRSLGCSVMVCVRLRRCAGDAILQVGQSLRIQRRPEESLGHVLFAIHVLRTAEPWQSGPPRIAMRTFGSLSYRHTSFRTVDNYTSAFDALKIVHTWSRHLIITKKGELYTCGNGADGHLGHGNERTEKFPKLVEALKGKRVVDAAIASFTVVLTDDGEVFGFGKGAHPDQSDYMPRPLESLEGKRVTQIAAGACHVVLLTSDGEVLTSGSWLLGRLGRGYEVTLDTEKTPKRVDALAGKRIVQVAAGDEHTAVLTDTGELFTFGRGDNGQLGHADNWDDQDLPYSVSALAWKRIVQVAAGSDHTVALSSEGEVFTFGRNKFGQLGHGDMACESERIPRRVDALVGRRVVQVAASSSHTAVLTCDGEVFTFGCGAEGQLGHVGSKQMERLPRKVEEALGGDKVVQLSCSYHTTAVRYELLAD